MNASKTWVGLVGLGLVAVTMTLAGCVSPTPQLPGSDASGSATVAMKDVSYKPAELRVSVGTTVTWVNEDSMGHTVTPTDDALWGSPGSGDASGDWLEKGDSWSFTFSEPGTYAYYCVPHAFKGSDGTWRGMVGSVFVSQGDSSSPSFQMPSTSIVPSPLASPVRQPDADGVVRIHLEAKELSAPVTEDAAYEYWTFGGTVPGPMLRVREGDQVEVTLANAVDSQHAHSIDLHAVTGPGGGAAATQTEPGQSTTFRFLAMHPGLYVYHCATPKVPDHVANGMYGMIYVEPKAPLPPADVEYYVVQGELYTVEPLGTAGMLSFSPEKLSAESPEYVVFNGRVGALTGSGALTAQVGQTVRLFFGVGGFVPSSFHVIGEVFDGVYLDGEPSPSQHRQTVMVPAAGSAVIDLKVDYPGTYVLVDHTLSRAFDRGAIGQLVVEGPADDEIFQG